MDGLFDDLTRDSVRSEGFSSLDVRSFLERDKIGGSSVGRDGRENESKLTLSIESPGERGESR